MNVSFLRSMAVLGLAALLAIFTGYYITQADYITVLSLVGAGIVLFLALQTSYLWLLAFGFLDPFSVPLPFIWGFPPLLLVLGICFFRQLMRGGLTHERQRFTSAMIAPFWIFFGWVAFRFCLNPSLPHFSGFGDNVTGFRSYLSYAICFVVVLTLGRFIRSRSDCLKLMRSMVLISLFLCLLFIGLMFTRNLTVASILQYLGVYVDVYDNGFFRFVLLPGLGIILMGVAMLPRLLPGARKSRRVFLFALGVLAVVLGGTRSGLGMALAIAIITPLLRRNFPRFAIMVGTAILLAITGYFAGEGLSKRDQGGMLRALALFSPDMAESTQASGTWEFRRVRWERALQEIQSHPLTGRGYGGLENAFVYRDWSSYEADRIEVDLASGSGVHNGYLACALTLGVPAAILFIGILIWSIWRNARLALRSRNALASDIHAFICATLIAYALSIYIGMDLNNPLIWFFVSLGVLMERMKPTEPVQTNSQARAQDSLLTTEGSGMRRRWC